MALSLKVFLLRLIYPPGVNPLPSGVCLILFLNLVLNSCTLTMSFAYLPKMMKTFGASEVEAGYYAGWVSSSLFIARTISSIVWGFLIDKFGAKTISLVSALCLSVTTIMFGFSYNFYWALCTRFLQGLSMGLIVASKSMFFEVSDNTNQPYGMTIITTASTTGLVLGPTLGGFLVLPAEKYPEDSIFRKFLFLLPNLVVGGLIGACAFSILLLPKSSKHRRDDRLLREDVSSQNYGSTENAPLRDEEEYWNLSVLSFPGQSAMGESAEPLHEQFPAVADAYMLRKDANAPDVVVVEKHSSGKNTEMKKILALLKNKDVMMTSGLYLLYSVASVGSDELFSVWAATDSYYHGLGFSPSEIGVQLLLSCFLILLTYPFISTRIANYLGCKKTMIVGSLILVVVSTIYPSTTRIQNRAEITIAVVVLIYVTRGCSSLCFTAINIFQNNTVTRDQLGIVNGLGITASSIGRSLAPIIVGSIYSWSLRNIKSVYKDGLGFPFNNYLAFLFLSFCFLMSAVWTAFIPDYLNFRKESKEEKNPQNLNKNMVQVSVRSFTYGPTS